MARNGHNRRIMTNIEEFLKSHQIDYVRYDHPAVYTCEEAEKYRGAMKGLASKNLLLRDEKGQRYFLVILPAKKRMDLKKFAGMVGAKKLTFAGDEILQSKLGLSTGAVSPFGLINDTNNEIKLYIDKEVDRANAVGFHPNVNTATLEISQSMFRKFLQAIGHELYVVDL